MIALGCSVESRPGMRTGRSLGGSGGGEKHDYPDVYDGARGVHFIEKTVESSKSEQKWTDAKWEP